VNINLIAFVRYVVGGDAVGQVLVVFIITIAAAEVGLALAIILRLFRNWDTVNLDRISTLQQ
jgi:NADH:ubiquinone oxidoreductase subunit K